MKQCTLGIFVVVVLGFCSCQKDDQRPVGKQGWLQGTPHKKMETVAQHLRGNDVVMWEVRRRHAELYQAILQHNHPYALYQLDKMVTTMKLGATRRPKRKNSYDWFFSHAIPPMKKALQHKQNSFPAFQTFTAACVACHAKENVSFIPVPQPWVTHHRKTTTQSK